MHIPFVFFYKQYIKKEGVRGYLEKWRKDMAFLLIGFTTVMVVMQFSIVTKIYNVFKEFNEPLPLITRLSPYIVGAIVVIYLLISIYFLFTSPDYEKLEKVLKKSKDGEMIRIGEIFDFRPLVLILILFGLAVLIIYASVVVPINNLPR